MFLIYLIIIGGSTFFIIHGYYQQLELQHRREYEKLGALVSSLAIEMDGDEISEMMKRYPNKDDIEGRDQDSTYQKYSTWMKDALKANDVKSPMYLLEYDKENDWFEYIIKSDANSYRHEYKQYPAVLLQQMHKGGDIPEHETENGVWISSFYPVKNSEGDVIGVLEADLNFTVFILSLIHI